MRRFERSFEGSWRQFFHRFALLRRRAALFSACQARTVALLQLRTRMCCRKMTYEACKKLRLRLLEPKAVGLEVGPETVKVEESPPPV